MPPWYDVKHKLLESRLLSNMTEASNRIDPAGDTLSLRHDSLASATCRHPSRPQSTTRCATRYFAQKRHRHHARPVWRNHAGLRNRSGRSQLQGPFSALADLPLHEYDALIYTSWFDELPNIILEAMGSRLPIIAPNLGGIGEAVLDGETDILIDASNDIDEAIYAYREAIERLYAQSAPLEKLSMRAVDYIHGKRGDARYVANIQRISV
ncbi:glycosyltransferase [Burkholderia ubonensis]|uniref:glycosyltransferase n=1 Tax=Burkholderia ubonensis TaxID=101571 RepID=UPI0009B451E8|nr:glycosyltransferase family 4 protein [Burkholderia ubonensis]